MSGKNGLSPAQLKSLEGLTPAQAREKKTFYSRQKEQNKRAKNPEPPSARGRNTPKPRANPPRGQTIPRPPQVHGGHQKDACSVQHAFNAFAKAHLPVDDITSPYTVTNLVDIMEFASLHDKDQVILIGSRSDAAPQSRPLAPITDVLACRYNAASPVDQLGIAAHQLGLLRSSILGKPALPENLTGQYSMRTRLHNLSICIQCMGTNDGLVPPGAVYCGRVPSLEVGMNYDHSTVANTLKEAWIEQSIAVGLLTARPAAALMNSPSTVHATVAESVVYKAWKDMLLTANDPYNLPISPALEPILIYIPRCGTATTAVQFRLSVGQEWCTKHPHDVLLRATQKQHDATNPGFWHSASAWAKKTLHIAGDNATAAGAAVAGRRAATYAFEAAL